MANPIKSSHLDGKQLVDTLVESVQRGWMPCYPTFSKGSTQLGREAAEAGMAPAQYVSQELREGRLHFAIEDPDAHHNVPKILANWRTNLLGSSAKGTEFFLRHMLGTGNEVNAEELEEGNRPASVNWREAHPGKLSPQRVQQHWRAVVDAGVDLFIIRGSTVSAEHVSSRREPLNLKRFIYELDVPVIVGGVCTDTARATTMACMGATMSPGAPWWGPAWTAAVPARRGAERSGCGGRGAAADGALNMPAGSVSDTRRPSSSMM